MPDGLIKGLISYAADRGLIEDADRVYCTNLLLGLLKKDAIDEDAAPAELPLHELLNGLCDYAAEKGIIEDSITYRDLFDTALMGVLTPRPGEVQKTFAALYAESPQKATDYFYALSNDTNYIRRDRIDKIIKWEPESDYGAIEITINLSKPEKDPKAIAAAKTRPSPAIPSVCCAANVRATPGVWISPPARITASCR